LDDAGALAVAELKGDMSELKGVLAEVLRRLPK
jgi:hypothetical protein